MKPPAPTTKRCATCGLDKPIAEFFRNPRTKDQRARTCKRCDGIYAWAIRKQRDVGILLARLAQNDVHAGEV